MSDQLAPVLVQTVLPTLLANTWMLWGVHSLPECCFNARPSRRSRWRKPNRQIERVDSDFLIPSDAGPESVQLSIQDDYLEIRLPSEPDVWIRIKLAEITVVADPKTTVVRIKQGSSRVCELVLPERCQRINQTSAELKQQIANRKMLARREALTSFFGRMADNKEPAVLIDVVPLFEDERTDAVIGVLVKFSNGRAIMIGGQDFEINGHNPNRLHLPVDKPSDPITSN